MYTEWFLTSFAIFVFNILFWQNRLQAQVGSQTYNGSVVNYIYIYIVVIVSLPKIREACMTLKL